MTRRTADRPDRPPRGRRTGLERAILVAALLVATWPVWSALRALGAAPTVEELLAIGCATRR